MADEGRFVQAPFCILSGYEIVVAVVIRHEGEEQLCFVCNASCVEAFYVWHRICDVSSDEVARTLSSRE